MSSWVCANCQHSLPVQGEASASAAGNAVEVRCPSCQFEHRIEFNPNRISYNADPLLRKENPKLWRLWKVLNNNGFLSYQWLPEGSISLPEREDVQRFRNFIEERFKRGKVLDIGCGILEVPGYLDFKNKQDVTLLGLDPIGESHFKGDVVIGVSEYLPWENGTIDNVIYATSMDHVCLLDKSLSEARRVLHDDGLLFVWMGNTNALGILLYRVLDFVRTGLFKNIRETIRLGCDAHRYQEYPNGTVFYIPKGAVDAFHRYRETPGFVIKAAKRNGFVLVDQKSHHRGEVFLAFRKKM